MFAVKNINRIVEVTKKTNENKKYVLAVMMGNYSTPYQEREKD